MTAPISRNVLLGLLGRDKKQPRDVPALNTYAPKKPAKKEQKKPKKSQDWELLGA